MKKLFTTLEWKKRNSIKIKNKNFELHLKKLYLKKKGLAEFKRSQLVHGGHLKSPRYYNAKPKNKDKFKTIPPPKDFSLINNCEAVLEYFEKAGDVLKDRNQINFNLSDIENLTPDSLTLLIAKIHDQRYTRGLHIKGSGPNRTDLNSMFKASGFFEYVQSSVIHVSSNLLIHKETHNKVEPEIAKQARILATKHTFNENRRYAPIYEILVECMANTNNHAGLDKRGLYNWWLFVYMNPNNNVTSFTFLDLGVGIFESIPVKKFRIPLFKKHNYELVPDLLEGIISSRTKEKERGRGFPLIYEHSKDLNIKRFIIISNDVYSDIKNGDHKKLNISFDGTLLYWEIDK